MTWALKGATLSGELSGAPARLVEPLGIGKFCGVALALTISRVRGSWPVAWV